MVLNRGRGASMLARRVSMRVLDGGGSSSRSRSGEVVIGLLLRDGSKQAGGREGASRGV